MWTNTVTGKISGLVTFANYGTADFPYSIPTCCTKCIQKAESCTLSDSSNYYEYSKLLRPNLLAVKNVRNKYISLIDPQTKQTILNNGWNIHKIGDYIIYDHSYVIYPDNSVKKLDEHSLYYPSVAKDYIFSHNLPDSECYVFDRDFNLLYKIAGQILCVCNEDIWPVWSAQVINSPKKASQGGKQSYYCPKIGKNILEIKSDRPMFLGWAENEAVESVCPDGLRLDLHDSEGQFKMCFIQFREFKKEVMELPEKVENPKLGLNLPGAIMAYMSFSKKSAEIKSEITPEPEKSIPIQGKSKLEDFKKSFDSLIDNYSQLVVHCEEIEKNLGKKEEENKKLREALNNVYSSLLPVMNGGPGPK